MALRISILAVLSSVFAVAMLSAAAPSSLPASSSQPASTLTDSRPIVKVSTVEELLAAIAPNRIIELTAGQYDLSSAKRTVSKYYRWENPFDNEYELVIRDVKNLTIRSGSRTDAHLHTKWTYANVLSFENSSNISIHHLKIGHTPDQGECIGGVVKLTKCQNVKILASTLYGCGTQGLELDSVENLEFESIIEDCNNGILTAKDCKNLVFRNSQFRNCGIYFGISLSDSTSISFSECTFQNNILAGETSTLFNTNLSEPADRVVLRKCTIENNSASDFINTAEMVRMDETVIRGNTWQAPAAVKDLRGKGTPRKEGGIIYHVPLGSVTPADIAEKVYGNRKQQTLILEANPKLPKLVPADTEVICPDAPE